MGKARKTSASETKKGRDTLLTPKVQAKIVKVIKEGNYLSTAAAEAEMDYRTVQRWMEKGIEGCGSVDDIEPREDWTIFRRFRRAVKRAESKRNSSLIKRIVADPSWQSDAWILERTEPGLYGRRDRLNIENAAHADKVMAYLHLCGDEAGMDRIANGEDPISVFLDRAPHIVWPDQPLP